MTAAFGTTGAFAAPGGNSADHASTVASPNMGVGNDNGNGNAKHDDSSTSSTSSSSSSSTTSTTTASTTTTAAPTTTSTASTPSTPDNGAPHGAQNCPTGSTDPLCNPQPNSNADQNSGGANGQCTDPNNMGPYCSTRDGSASGNGNGNGNAVGKPCAGCVGKADNKNPKGQMPNGSDHNAGYECDRNHGIGRTNPAHTGCKSTPPPTCVPTEANNFCGSGHHDCVPTAANDFCGSGHHDCVPTAANNNCGSPPSTCVPSASNNNCTTSGGGSTCTPTAANNFCSNVLGEKVTKTPTTTKTTKTPKTTKVVGERLVKTPTGTLPFTGANVALLLASGLGGIALGSTLLMAGRRRRASA